MDDLQFGTRNKRGDWAPSERLLRVPNCRSSIAKGRPFGLLCFCRPANFQGDDWK